MKEQKMGMWHSTLCVWGESFLLLEGETSIGEDDDDA